jgi:4-diphosphocytidyl-2-C-methyl-D-erythritol kinase
LQKDGINKFSKHKDHLLRKEDTISNPQLTLKAPAKINLFLKVVGRRTDGYHDIESLMQKVELADELRFYRQEEGISLTCSNADLPEDKENLVYRAAQLFYDNLRINPVVRIRLDKKIPVAAGLGGGSSDAAAVLLGLNDLLKSDLNQEQLLDLARQLGADVPFFITPCSAAMASGIGDQLQEVTPLADIWIVLVNPGFGVSTKWVYENLPLTTKGNTFILARDRKLSEDFFSNPLALSAEQGNDLEMVTVKRYPEIGEIKETLKNSGAAAVLMSGSGPTVFGLFEEKKLASNSVKTFTGEYGKNVFLTRPYIP